MSEKSEKRSDSKDDLIRPRDPDPSANESQRVPPDRPNLSYPTYRPPKRVLFCEALAGVLLVILLCLPPNKGGGASAIIATKDSYYGLLSEWANTTHKPGRLMTVDLQRLVQVGSAVGYWKVRPVFQVIRVSTG